MQALEYLLFFGGSKLYLDYGLTNMDIWVVCGEKITLGPVNLPIFSQLD
jgi:hypothetical protein